GPSVPPVLEFDWIKVLCLFKTVPWTFGRTSWARNADLEIGGPLSVAPRWKSSNAGRSVTEEERVGRLSGLGFSSAAGCCSWARYLEPKAEEDESLRSVFGGAKGGGGGTGMLEKASETRRMRGGGGGGAISRWGVEVPEVGGVAIVGGKDGEKGDVEADEVEDERCGVDGALRILG